MPNLDDDPFRTEFNKRETRKRTLKSWLFLGFIFLIFVIMEALNGLDFFK